MKHIATFTAFSIGTVASWLTVGAAVAPAAPPARRPPKPSRAYRPTASG